MGNRFTSDRRLPADSSWSGDGDWSAGIVEGVDIVEGKLVCSPAVQSAVATESWDNLSGWSKLGYGIVTDSTRAVSGDAAYMGHDRRGGPFPVSSNGERTKDGGILDLTVDQSPREGAVETTTYINYHSTQNNSAGLRFRVQDVDNCYVTGVSSNRNEFWVNVWSSGSVSNIDTVDTSRDIPNGRAFTQRVEMVEASSGELVFTLFVDGREAASITDNDPQYASGGAIGLGMGGDDGDVANYNSAYTGWWTDDTKILI